MFGGPPGSSDKLDYTGCPKKIQTSLRVCSPINANKKFIKQIAFDRGKINLDFDTLFFYFG